MIKSIIELILHKYLHKFFYGIDKKNIETDLLEGKIVISNIGLQENLLDSLNLPIQISYSYVEKVEISIPWLSEEVSLNIFISNIYALLTPRRDLDILEAFMSKKRRVIESAVESFRQASKAESSKEPGAIEKMIIKLLDNINLHIGCVHFRYENRAPEQKPGWGQLVRSTFFSQKKAESPSASAGNYSFGLKINNVSVFNVDEEGKRTFFNREKNASKTVNYQLAVDFIGLYFNDSEARTVYRRPEANRSSKESKKNYAEMTDLMRQLSFPEKFRSEGAESRLDFILVISVKTLLRHSLEEHSESPQFRVQIQLDCIDVKISNEQFCRIKEVVDFFSSFQNYWEQYCGRMHVGLHMNKSSHEISDLLRKKNLMEREGILSDKEQLSIRRNLRVYLQYVFRRVYLESLQKSFVFRAAKEEVTAANLFKDKKLVAIVKITEQSRLREWVAVALKYRRQFVEGQGLFEKHTKVKFERNFAKLLRAEENSESVPNFEHLLKKEHNKAQLELKVSHLNFVISRAEVFGVEFIMKDLYMSLHLRNENYTAVAKLSDVQANAFSKKDGQKSKTVVPIVKRSCTLKNEGNFLYFRYQKAPAWKVDLNAEVLFQIEEIEVAIYPEAFKQFYEILFEKSGSAQKDETKKKSKSPNNNYDSFGEDRSYSSMTLRRNIIKGKVKSPWVIFPLGRNNDPEKQCWVVRLGDLSLDTPESEISEMGKEKNNVYEKYKVELKQFELNFFSSVNLFYSWRKFNEKTQQLLSLPIYKKSAIIPMISPFTCWVDFWMLKAAAPASVRNNNFAYVADVHISKINIAISNFLLGKLKSRIDLVGDEEKFEEFEFIESSVLNIYQEGSFKEWCKVSHGAYVDMRMFFVLKGHFMYFFMSDCEDRYHFFIDIRSTYIRLVSNRIEKVNPQKTNKATIKLPNPASAAELKKQLNFLIQKKDLHENQKKSNKTVSEAKVSKEDEKRGEQDLMAVESDGSKVKFNFEMEVLSIKLIDKKQEQFLLLDLEKTSFTYESLKRKAAHLTLRNWNIFESEEDRRKERAFLSSSRFYGGEPRERQEGGGERSSNFLEVRADFSEISDELKLITVDIDKLFIGWKVDLITKVLVFFFYSEEVGDELSPVSAERRRLDVRFRIKKFYLYCFQGGQLAGLIRLYNSDICYAQDGAGEEFNVSFQKFEIDENLHNDYSDRQPSLVCSNALENPLQLKYRVKRRNFEGETNIRRLQGLLGEDLTVSEISCHWRGCTIYYSHEVTFRMLNYFLNQVLGTVAAKFKKRIYSPKYVHETLKLHKISVIDVSFENFVFLLHPHDKAGNHLLAKVAELRISKNNRDDEFRPRRVTLPTLFDPVDVFHESMVVELFQVDIFDRYGNEKSLPINREALDLRIVSSKVNLPAQFYSVLKDVDDFDRSNTLTVEFSEGLQLEFPKILFITVLQIFYQNIKHKDGRAQIFEPPLPYAAKKNYIVKIPSITANLYEFLPDQNKMQTWNQLRVSRFQIVYQLRGTVGNLKLTMHDLQSVGELPLQKNQGPEAPLFELSMVSEPEKLSTLLNLQIEGYKIDFKMAVLDDLLEYISYDSETVANKLMKPKADSIFNVKVQVQNCVVNIGSLSLSGVFLVTYQKLSGPIDLSAQAEEFLLSHNLSQGNNASSSSEKSIALSRKDSVPGLAGLVTKKIRLQGLQLSVRVRGLSCLSVAQLAFNRDDYSLKSSLKRFKKQSVGIDRMVGAVQGSLLPDILEAFRSKIQKPKNSQLKSLFAPWNKPQEKKHLEQLRVTELRIKKAKVAYYRRQITSKPFQLIFEVSAPRLAYTASKAQSQVRVQASVTLQQFRSNSPKPYTILEVRNPEIQLKSNKVTSRKDVLLDNAKEIKVHAYNVDLSALRQIAQPKGILGKESGFTRNSEGKSRAQESSSATFNASSIHLVNETSHSLELLLPLSKHCVSAGCAQLIPIETQELVACFQQSYTVEIDCVDESQRSRVLSVKASHPHFGEDQLVSDDLRARVSLCNKRLSILVYQGLLLENYSNCSLRLLFQRETITLPPKCAKSTVSWNSPDSSANWLRRSNASFTVTLSNASHSRKQSQEDPSSTVLLKQGSHTVLGGLLSVEVTLKGSGKNSAVIRNLLFLKNLSSFAVQYRDKIIGHRQEEPLKDIRNVQIVVNQELMTIDCKTTSQLAMKNGQRLQIIKEGQFLCICQKILILNKTFNALKVRSVKDRRSQENSSQIQIDCGGMGSVSSDCQFIKISNCFRSKSSKGIPQLEEDSFSIAKLKEISQATDMLQHQPNFFAKIRCERLIPSRPTKTELCQTVIEIFNSNVVINLTDYQLTFKRVFRQSEEIGSQKSVFELRPRQGCGENLSQWEMCELRMSKREGQINSAKFECYASDCAFLQMSPNILFKVTVECSPMGSSESSPNKRFVIDEVDKAYSVINDTDDIVIDAQAGTAERVESHEAQEEFKRDNRLVNEELGSESAKESRLIQPGQSQEVGFSTSRILGKELQFSFYYPLKNIDFELKWKVNLESASKERVCRFDLEHQRKKVRIPLLALVETLKEGRVTVRFLKKEKFESLPIETLQFRVKELRLAMMMTREREETITAELCDLDFQREKQAEITGIVVEAKRFLVFQGSSFPILSVFRSNRSESVLRVAVNLLTDSEGRLWDGLTVELTPVSLNIKEQIILDLLSLLRSRSQESAVDRQRADQLEVGRGGLENQEISHMRREDERSYIQSDMEFDPQSAKEEEKLRHCASLIYKALQQKSKPKRTIRVSELKVKKTDILLSYKKFKMAHSLEDKDRLMSSFPFIKYLTVLPEIGETKLSVPRLHVPQFRGSSKEFLKMVGKEVKVSIGTSILETVSSLSILDNPIQAIDEVLRYILAMLGPG